MKPKLLHVLTVSLLTLVVLSPAFVVISVVWKQHLDFMATQNLVYEVTNSQPLTIYGENTTARISLWLMICTPVSLCLGISLYIKYIVDRAAALNRQIEMLERIWQQNSVLEGATDETNSDFNPNSDCWYRSYRN